MLSRDVARDQHKLLSCPLAHGGAFVAVRKHAASAQRYVLRRAARPNGAHRKIKRRALRQCRRNGLRKRSAILFMDACVQIAALEERRLVTRMAHPTDRRQVVLTVTAEGRELVYQARRLREAWLAMRLQELSPQERATLRAAAPILEKLSQS